MKRWFPIWIYPVILVMAIGTVWLRLDIINTTYEISQIDLRIRNQQQAREQAELHLANLRSPRRLEAIARTRLQLTKPRQDQVIYLK